MKGRQWNSLYLGLFSACWLFLSTTITQASEVCVDRQEFVHFLHEKRLLKERNRIHERYIAELKSHIAEQDQGIMTLTAHGNACDALIKEYADRHDQLQKEIKQLEYDTWMERGKGFGVGVVIGAVVVFFLK